MQRDKTHGIAHVSNSNKELVEHSLPKGGLLPILGIDKPDNAWRGISSPWVLFSGWIIFTSLLFVQQLFRLFRLAMSNPDASHLILIPFLAAGLFYIERRSIFRTLSTSLGLGSLLVALGIGLVVSTRLAGLALTPDLQLACYISALVLFWTAGFSFFFGGAALKAAYFPLLFLWLMVPLPNFLVQRIIYLLRAGSADITGALFDLLGVPALREGFVFHLAQVNIEIAKECSGIRSSMALFVLALPVVHFGLRRFWKKLLFLVCALLIMILKNGIRIVTLTVLAIYVDPGFLHGKLHHDGGVVFFLLGMLLLLPVYLLLRGGAPTLPEAEAATPTSPR
ncbi:MAG: exosortase/archaeosortase family protein [Candidatus Acidiferrum sp.]